MTLARRVNQHVVVVVISSVVALIVAAVIVQTAVDIRAGDQQVRERVVRAATAGNVLAVQEADVAAFRSIHRMGTRLKFVQIVQVILLAVILDLLLIAWVFECRIKRGKGRAGPSTARRHLRIQTSSVTR